MAPIDVAAGCPEQPLRGPSEYAQEPEVQLIDDFEHDDAQLPKFGGRTGSWVWGGDGTGMVMEAGTSDQCAGRGARAAHFAGNGFTNWGVNWTALMLDQPAKKAVPYDASRYGGISFWAAVGPDVPTPFALPVGVTTMDVAWNGGICMNNCMDYYRTTVMLDHAWRRYEFRFSELSQGAGAQVIPLRIDQLVGFIVWPNHDFDLWLDDVRFEQ